MKTDQLANEEGADKPGGPLAGFRVVEMTGRGPGPFCAMLLADLGADVVRVARPGTSIDPTEVLARSRTVVEIDLKAPGAAGQVLCLIEAADMLRASARASWRNLASDRTNAWPRTGHWSTDA